MTILIDTREQTPWSFSEGIKTEVGTLKQGDYAIKGDNTFAIERKSLNDFVGTITTGWERFQRELDRMDKAGFHSKVIIVEADLERCAFTEENGHINPPSHDHINVTPQCIFDRIARLQIFHRCSVYFAGNPGYAAGLAQYLFFNRLKQLKGDIPK